MPKRTKLENIQKVNRELLAFLQLSLNTHIRKNSDKLELIFTQYFQSLMSILRETGVLRHLNLSAGIYDVLEDQDLDSLVEVVSDRKQGYAIEQNKLNSILTDIINSINMEKKYKAMLEEFLNDVFIIGAIMANACIIADSYIINNKYGELNYIRIVDRLRFEFEDMKSKNYIRERCYSASFLTKAGIKRITKLLLREFFKYGKSQKEVFMTFFEIYGRKIIKSRAELLVRTETNIIKNKAILRVGEELKVPFKEWVFLDKERAQHKINGDPKNNPVKFFDTFKGGNKEYSPADCANPFSCSCSISLIPDIKVKKQYYWDGIVLVPIVI